MIRASFSDDGTAVNVSLPQSWQDLDSEELEKVYRAMEIYADEDVRFHLLRILGGICVDRGFPHPEGKWRCIVSAERDGKPAPVVVFLSADDLAGWVDEFDWIAEPGKHPVRVREIGGAEGLRADFHGVDFQTYYMLENLYQGYLYSQNSDAVARMEALLYPGMKQEGEPPAWRVLNAMNWMVQVKGMFSEAFPNFFQPSGGESDGPPNMLEVMNAQIRALTGGDVTKEDIVNRTDCWRALTELDAKAREAKELKKMQSKTGK